MSVKFRNIGAVTAALALLVQPCVASAQITGSRIGGSRVDVPHDLTGIDRARYTLLKLGECMVKQRSARAERYVETFPHTEEALKQARPFLHQEDCLSSGDVEMTEGNLRAAIYAALYRLKYVPGEPAGLATAPAVDYANGIALGDMNEAARQVVAVRQMGDCVVRADHAASHALIASEINSQKEKAAFAAITAKIPECITQGVTLKLNKMSLHGIIAESLYRLAEAARTKPPAAAAGN